MEKTIVNLGGTPIAIFKSNNLLVTDGQSALELAATVAYEDQCQRIVLCKEAIAEDFFKLSTGLAGEVLQKFVQFRAKVAIVGDFSGYTSKSLRDFIGECNRGNQFFFVADEEEALARLAAAK